MTSTVDLREGSRAELEQLRTSARGWHGAQLAVLGFIGLCGALHDAGDATGPPWLQQVAAALVLMALAVACVATVLVATEAWPLRGASGTPELQARHTVGHLRLGIGLTFVAVGMAALATSSSWWPADVADSHLVTVTTSQGTLCGRLLDAQEGAVVLDVAGRRLAVPLDQVAGLGPVQRCPG